MAAHRVWLAENGKSRKRPAAVDADGNCIAERHGTCKAYIAGCRHPEAVRKYEAYQQRRRDADNVRRDAAQALIWERDSQRAKRLTGGRLTQDPRRPWRGGRMAVDRNNLWMLMHGLIDSPTMMEKLAALNRLDGTLVPSDGWFEAPHVITTTELASRLGCTITGIRSLRKTRADLAGKRAQRRLADVQWKAAVAAEAAGRADRVREDHARAAVERAARTAIWEHRRTLRRMADARKQARRG
jgi:hypothetical protein